MRKSYKYRLYPKQIIKTVIDKNLEICRWFYNYLHQERIKVWEKDKTIITYAHQQNLLPNLKKVHPFLKEIQSQVLQDVIRRLDKAWKDFYQRIKRKEKLEKLGKKEKEVHYPRFKQYGRYDSFTYTQKQDRIELKHSQLWLSKLGWMNIRKHRKLEGIIKTCSLLIKNQKYYACFSCEVEAQPKIDTKLISLDKQIDIDASGIRGINKTRYRRDHFEKHRRAARTVVPAPAMMAFGRKRILIRVVFPVQRYPRQHIII